MPSKIGTSTKPLMEDKNDKNRSFLDMTKQRVFNKRLHLNSELCIYSISLVENLTKGSLEKYEIPQTSKHEKKSNISFRK